MHFLFFVKSELLLYLQENMHCSKACLTLRPLTESTCSAGDHSADQADDSILHNGQNHYARTGERKHRQVIFIVVFFY